jgi:hypothetical protein
VTVDDVEWPYLPPDPRAKSRPNQRHFIHKRPPIQQLQVERQIVSAYVLLNQFLQPIDILVYRCPFF